MNLMPPLERGPDDPQSDVSSTMAARIGRAIRRDILNGTISPGDRLRAVELSLRYGSSHIPVREALRQLEADRLVEIDPHKGAILRRVDRKFVVDVHDTREAIERLLVRKCTENAGPAEWAELDRLESTYEDAASAGDLNGMVTANRQFHRYIADVADNAEAAQILNRGWELVISLTNRYGRGPDRVAEIIDQHRRLIAAIRSGDVSLAMRVVEEHCESAKEDLLRQMILEENDRGVPLR
jgi:DNA-binding GntR family transcriptional regulator